MATYLIRNDNELKKYPWFISTCSNQFHANQILKNCQTIENGNFFVRGSENKHNKYTITLWFDNSSTHVRINELDNGQYRLDFEPARNNQIPVFPTIEKLIDYYSKSPMKLIGHCQGFVRLKFNPNILNYVNPRGGIGTTADSQHGGAHTL